MTTATLTREEIRSPHGPAPSSSTARDPWFDNVKMVLVTLVVVGHSWTLLPETWVVDHLYNWLYLWHIPAFVMVTGYLSRRFSYTRPQLRRLVTTVLIPYLVLEGVFALFRVHVGGEKLERLWLNPHWPMWYLIVLVMWRLATPALRRLPHPVPVAVAVSLMGGLVAVETFDTNRALGLLPFFTLGLLAEKRHLDLLRTRTARLAGLPVLAGGFLVAAWVETGISTEWLYYRRSYAELDTAWYEGIPIRLALIVVAVSMTLAALAWIPRRGGWLSRMGAASLVVYLFHGFAVKGAEYAGYPDWAADQALTALLVTTTVSVVVALVLAWRPVAKPLEKVVTPNP